MPSPVAKPVRRPWLFRLAALGLVLATMAALEGVSRWAWYRSTYDDDGAPTDLHGAPVINKNWLRFVPDPLLERRYHPNRRLKLRMFNQITARWSPYTFATNSLGYRGPEIAVTKPPNTVRIVALGGSSTMGQGVAIEKTYIHRLAALLRPHLPGKTVEALNAAVQGRASRHGFLQYAADIKKLSPDLLVVAYDINDGHKPYSGAQLAAIRDPRDRVETVDPSRMPHRPYDMLADLPGQVAQRSAVTDALRRSGLFFAYKYAVGWVKRRLEPGQAYLPAPPLTEAEKNPPPRFCPARAKLGAIALPWESHVTKYEENLIALSVLAAQDKVPLIYLSVPVESFADLGSPRPYSTIMARLARQPQRAHVDPGREAFCKHPLGEVMFDFCHPTAKGHGIIARQLLPAAKRLLKAK